MPISKAVSFILLILLLSAGIAPAQTQPPTQTPTATDPAEAEAKQKAKEELERQVVELINRTVSEASSLKLPENRAYVLSIAAEHLWKFDDKRAKELARNSLSELMNAQYQAETDALESDSPSTQPGTVSLPGESDRIRIITMIARRDADLAQELMMQTRNQKIADALAKHQTRDTVMQMPTITGGGGTGNAPNNQYLASMELALEQTIARFSAEQNPDKAIKLIREGMAKGVTLQVWSMIQRLYALDKEKGKTLAAEMVLKIQDSDLTIRQDERSLVINLLGTYKPATTPAASTTATANTDKSLRLEDKQLRDLAVKLSDTYMKFNVEPMMISLNGEISRAIPLIEKLAPERIALLKQKQAAITKSLPAPMKTPDAFARLSGQNVQPEDVLSEAARLSVEQRPRYYELALQKISRITDEARARSLINQLPDERYRARGTEALESARISRLAAEGKLEEALRLIAGITRKQSRLEKLVSLAISFQKRKKEKDLESAASVMEQARGMITDMPENLDDMDNLAQVVRGYVEIEPARAFRLMEPVFSEIDVQMQAAATVSKFERNNRSFKKGELVMVSATGGSGSLLSRFQGIFRSLARADFATMVEYSEKIQRPEAKLMVRLAIIQSALIEERPLAPIAVPAR